MKSHSVSHGATKRSPKCVPLHVYTFDKPDFYCPGRKKSKYRERLTQLVSLASIFFFYSKRLCRLAALKRFFLFHDKWDVKKCAYTAKFAIVCEKSVDFQSVVVTTNRTHTNTPTRSLCSPALAEPRSCVIIGRPAHPNCKHHRRRMTMRIVTDSSTCTASGNVFILVVDIW